MPKVDSFKLEGLSAFFYSLDHPPPHFHVRKKDKWEIRVMFMDCTNNHLAFTYAWPQKAAAGFAGPSVKERRDLLHLTLSNRPELLQEWTDKVWAPEEPS